MLCLAYDRSNVDKARADEPWENCALINDLNGVNPLFYFSFYIKQLLNGFPCRIA